ncbi:hypothetical protein SJ05684_c17050 [Sinorhizobium sojae CCBAU 05684]|uniref:Uncharacterized protein n=1 Tax=Sinorhizobium sojae CCBAU 05684 TaxID=716928 RepID=A0A249PBQ9_9HYPH|nr:hypothetical protein SJ05684_c17050 [Sinorhizobium sojae CCBAU 05684]
MKPVSVRLNTDLCASERREAMKVRRLALEPERGAVAVPIDHHTL